MVWWLRNKSLLIAIDIIKSDWKHQKNIFKKNIKKVLTIAINSDKIKSRKEQGDDIYWQGIRGRDATM